MPNPIRRLIFGAPFETHQAHHTKLPNALALPVFASDALSSVAYATEEILLVLVTVGVSRGVLGFSWPIGIAIALLLGIVAASYRQTIYAYPQGGGAYRVSKENLGLIPGLTAAASLLIDYVLTVAVSISAGVAAITSAAPGLQHYSVLLGVGFVIFIASANLRGAKESGLLFAVPTYSFIFSIGVMLAVGFGRLLMGHHMAPPSPPPGAWADAARAGGSVGLFLVFRAFASGCTALTGVEAVTDGVPAFRAPESKNAAKVMVMLGTILITMFLGITFLADRLHVVPFPAEEGPGVHRQTVVSQIAYAVFGNSWFYYVTQITTAMILVLAANTAFVDFPRLSMFLAQDRFLPRQMANVGDRLVYSNGILGLALLSIFMVVAFGASTHHLIPLYALGVFLSFTLSQFGMVARWIKLRPAGWHWGVLMSGTGGAATFVVLLIISITKFAAGDPVSVYPITTPLGLWLVISGIAFVLISMLHRWMGRHLLIYSAIGLAIYGAFFSRGRLLDPIGIHLGAWMVMVAIPVLVWMFFRIHSHYLEIADHLTMSRFDSVPDFKHTVLVLVPGVHRGIMPAVKYARSIGGDIRGVYVEVEPAKTPDVLERWRQWVPDIPLVVLDSPYRALTEPLLDYIDRVERERDDDVVTVILPEFVPDKWWTVLLHNQNGLLLKWALLFKKGVVVTNIRYHLNAGVDEDLGLHPLTSTREEREEAAARLLAQAEAQAEAHTGPE